jgi:hypothetical protein
MKLGGSSNANGFMIYDYDTRIAVRSENYEQSFIVVPIFRKVTPAEQASIEDAMRDNRISKWHATEHKLVNLLMSSKTLTLENLKAEPMTHPDCGTHNRLLKEPEEYHLREAINVGLEYLRRKQTISSKN